MAMVLHGETLWISPCVLSSFVALREKKLSFDVTELSLVDGGQQVDGYRALSLTNRVPTLEHDGFAVSESSAIAEYLEETFPPPSHPRLFPSGRTERARARKLMAWLRSDLGALREERPTVSMFYDAPTARPERRRAAGASARVQAYAEREWARPSVQEFVTHARPAVVPDGYWSIPGNVRPAAKR